MAGFVQVDTSLHFMACYIKHHTSYLLESSDIISQVSQPRYRVHLFREKNKQTNKHLLEVKTVSMLQL